MSKTNGNIGFAWERIRHAAAAQSFCRVPEFVAIGLLAFTLLGTGAGLVTYNTAADAAQPDPAAQTAPPARQATRSDTIAELKREIERLRLELEQARLLLKVANQEILDLRAARAEAGTGKKAAEGEAERLRGFLRDDLLQDRAKTQGKKGDLFSPDRKLIAVTQGESFRLLDAETGKEIRRFLGHAAPVTSLAFSPDGKRLASGSKDKSIFLWDLATGKQLVKIELRDAVDMVVYSADGRVLVVRARGQTFEIDPATGKLMRSKEEQ